MVRLAYTLLLLAALVACGPGAGVNYVCHLDGRVRSHCCCQAATANGHAAARAEHCCCDVRRSEAPPAQARLEACEGHVLPVLVAVLPALVPAAGAPLQPPRPRSAARGPPAGTRARLQRYCTYLI